MPKCFAVRVWVWASGATPCDGVAPSARCRQRGASLLEVLVAMIVVALGVLAVVGMQLRTLSHAQDSVRRTQAIRLIDDLSDRLRLLPDAYSQSSHYLREWGDVADASLAAACQGAVQPCSVSHFAQADAQRWLQAVHNALPLGQANVFTTDDTRQLGVMLAWRQNEASESAASVIAPPSTGATQVQCPAQRTCHLQYISLAQRCIPLDAGNALCP